jgi:hypothetical protein
VSFQVDVRGEVSVGLSSTDLEKDEPFSFELLVNNTAYDDIDNSGISKLEIMVWENGDTIECNQNLEYEAGSEFSIRIDGDRRFYYKEQLIYTSKQVTSFPLAV